jgi:peptide/nickel transport system permease protein
MVLACLAAPVISPYSPDETRPEAVSQPPSSTHWLGTDYLGRDVLARLLYGGQRTLFVAGAATLLAALSSVILVTASLVVPFVAGIVYIVARAVLAFPMFIFVLLLLLVAGRHDVGIILALGLGQVAGFVTLLRVQAGITLSRDYVTASAALGATRQHLVHTHIRRDTWPTVMWYTSVIFAYTIGSMATLGFLGIDPQPGRAEWGAMLAEARYTAVVAPWGVLAPASAIAGAIWSVQRIGVLIHRQHL